MNHTKSASAGAYRTDEDHRTQEKALQVNLEPRIYGTFAEIGGGQEASRWFFRVGGAAGTVAKTISAYDMQFSDAVYGKGSRYVSRERIKAMLDHEYRLLEERLKESRGEQSCFFVFADTVSARSFKGNNECHGWVGLRFQSEPNAQPNDILLHVNLLDSSNLRQQQALGTLGVNLVYGAFYEMQSTDQFLSSLLESVGNSRLEIDFASMTGPAFEAVDPKRIPLLLLRHGLCHLVGYEKSTAPTVPTELLHKRALIMQRGSLQHRSKRFEEMMRRSEEALRLEDLNTKEPPMAVFELTINNARPDDAPDDDELLKRIGRLAENGFAVLVSDFMEAFNLTEQCRRYTQEPIRFAVGIGTLVQVMQAEFYTGIGGGILEALGRFLSSGVKVYVFPMSARDFARQLAVYKVKETFCGGANDNQIVTAKNLRLEGPIQNLYRYMVDSGAFVAIEQSLQPAVVSESATALPHTLH